jgi:AcrR family transcriptional regulator
MSAKAGHQDKTERFGSRNAHEAAGPNRRDRKRAAIVAAAKDVFFREGYAGASMDEIAARSGASKATLYAHFGSKEALLLAVVDAVLEPIRTAMSEAPREQDQALDGWLVQLGCMAAHQMMSPEIIALQRLAIAEAARFPEIARALHQTGTEAAFNQSALPTLRAAMAEGELRSDDPEVALSHFFEMCFGKRLRDVLMGLQRVPNKGEIERDVRFAVAAFMGGWRPPMEADAGSTKRRPSRT